MNPFKSMWQWRLFGWKIFSTVVISASALMITGLSTGDGTLIPIAQAMRWMFWLGVLSGTVKAVDSLFDQTFGNIKSALANGNGNGNGHPLEPVKPIDNPAPSDTPKV